MRQLYHGMNNQMLKGMPDLQYPSWEKTHENLGKLYKAGGVPLYNDYVASQANIFGAGTKSNRNCSHPNGKIYFSPYTSTSMLVFDPDTDTYSTITAPRIGYVGAVCVGRLIYFTPYTNDSVLIYDPDKNVFASVQISSGNALHGEGIANPDGKIYMTPLTGTGFGIYDTRNNTYKKMSIANYGYGVSTDNAQCNAMIGYTYYAMSSGNAGYRMWMIDTRTDEWLYAVGNIPNSGIYVGMDVGKDGNIYAVPFTGSTSFLKFDPVKQKFSLVPGTTTGFVGAVRNIDGNIVAIPHQSNTWSVLVVDTQIIYNRFFSGNGTSAFAGGCLDKYGRVIAAPHNTTWSLHIGTKGAVGEIGSNLYCNHNWSNLREERYNVS